MTAPRSLSREQIAAELNAIRVRVIAAKWHDFNIPWAELENAYGDISCDALQRNFSTVGELMSYVHEALRRDALDITKSAGFRASTLTAGDGERMPAPVQSPEHAVLAREARELLHEFLAELCERDRTIGYLYLDPSCEYTPRRIAAELGLPKREVTKTLDRVGIRLRRFTALAVQPGALCAHHRRDVLHWQQTGSLPLALRLHLRRCHACRCAQRQAQEAVRAAILRAPAICGVRPDRTRMAKRLRPRPQGRVPAVKAGRMLPPSAPVAPAADRVSGVRARPPAGLRFDLDRIPISALLSHVRGRPRRPRRARSRRCFAMRNRASHSCRARRSLVEQNQHDRLGLVALPHSRDEGSGA